MTKRVVLVKLLVSAALVTGGCIRPAIELHGGLSPVPSKMPDAGFAGVGTAFDAGLIAFRVPWQARVPADALAAWAIRDVCLGRRCRWFGRSADSGFMFTIGVYVPEFIRFVTVHHR